MPTHPRDLLRGDPWVVAPRLLGWRLRRSSSRGEVTVELTEVEAYAGESDPGSHAFRGPTPRNRVMFAGPGHLYAYRSHGIHVCINLVTGEAGRAAAVLLRAGRVVQGADLARERRGEHVADRSLARGPGCLAQALGVDLAESGTDVLASPVWDLAPGREPAPDEVSAGPRVGVSRGHEVPWRFWVAGDPTVSAYRRSPRARSAGP